MSVPRASALPTRLLHISDLHVGSREALPVERALEILISRIEPELIVASGDLTHRGRPAQHEQAASFLRALGPPVLAIPGNHDIPYTFPARFTQTFAEFDRIMLDRTLAAIATATGRTAQTAASALLSLPPTPRRKSRPLSMKPKSRRRRKFGRRNGA